MKSDKMIEDISIKGIEYIKEIRDEIDIFYYVDPTKILEYYESIADSPEIREFIRDNPPFLNEVAFMIYTLDLLSIVSTLPLHIIIEIAIFFRVRKEWLKAWFTYAFDLDQFLDQLVEFH